MKNIMTVICATALLTASVALSAGNSDKGDPSSAAFERLKTLVGTWQGKVDIGEGPVDMTVQYRLLAGGSVLEERCFIGTPNEMVTMYYQQDGKLALTHYCMMGNRPAMLLTSSDEKTLKFEFDPTCGINPEKESHMHALTIRFDDPDTITTSCKALVEGKPMEEQPTTLRRVQS